MNTKQNKKSSITIRDFFRQFPTDDACLAHIFTIRFGKEHYCGKCERNSKWHKIKAERAYSCQFCGDHLHPTVGTPFEDSRTPLQLWFYAIYLFTTSRHGVPAKELQRQLGVTYKCAWRMGHQIRKHITEVDSDIALFGNVEVDETYVGGKQQSGVQGLSDNKTIVVGLLQRDGQVVTEVVENTTSQTLQNLVEKNVTQDSTVHTDEHVSYKGLKARGYAHKTVNHSAGEYVRGTSHVNNLENFWKHLKGSIRGTHMHVSKKHLAKYAKEFEFRYNNKKNPILMFDSLVSSFSIPA